MTHSARVYFNLKGDFVPAEATAAIGIEPTHAEMARERIPGQIPVCSHWEYSTEKVESEIIDIAEMSSRIVRDLAPFANRIAMVVRRHDLTAVIEVVLWVCSDQDVSTPVVGFESDVIGFLQRVGGTIDLDMYTIESEEIEKESRERC